MMRLTGQVSILKTFLLFLVVLAVFPVVSAATPGVIERGGRVAIVGAEDATPQLRLAVADLETFLERSLLAVVRRYPSGVDVGRVDEPVCLIIGAAGQGTPLIALAEKAGVRVEPALGQEGCQVKSAVWNGKLLVFLVGKTTTGASYAAYSFLENELGIGFFIDGDQIPALDSVDLSHVDRTETPVVRIRGLFFHYIWKHPYANCWRLWSWDGWKKSIDWMRRKRFNTLPLFHDEGGYLWGDVLFKTFPEIPRNDKTLSQFVVDPTWRTELNKKIFAYSRASGINIAYNLFYSQVPEFFADFHPELKYHELNMRNVGISALQPECRQIMKRYWKAILDTYGIDDSHLYLVCSYQHERSLPTYYENKNEPTRQVLSLIKELDPKAEMFIETWCWKYRQVYPRERVIEGLTANVAKEWKVFDAEIPKEVGVVEWDLHRNHGDGLPKEFGGRRYIQLTHTNMEGWWPPSTTRNPPRWLVDYFATALENHAEGFLFFHIQAGHSDINADLAAAMCWTRRVDLDRYYRDYARRRFGQQAAEPLAESVRLFCDAADFGATSQTKEVFVTLSFPGFAGSAETQLADVLKKPLPELHQWIEDHQKMIRPKAELAARAMLAARAVAPLLKDQEMYKRYVWELDYLAARFEGIENLYQAHLIATRQPELAEQRFQRAMVAFDQIKNLFRDRKEYHMSEIRNLAPEVPYTAAFLKDWETRGYWEPRSKSFHVVWERIPEFEAFVHSLRPRSKEQSADRNGKRASAALRK